MSSNIRPSRLIWLSYITAFLAILTLGDLGRHAFEYIFLILIIGLSFAMLLFRTTHGTLEVRNLEVLAMALGIRIVFLAAQPTLSDDIYRYLWDGKVALSGTNPYLFAPDSPVLESLRDQQFEKINNKSVPTIYPPFSQMIFLLTDLVGHSVVLFKSVFALFDLAVFLALLKLLKKLRLKGSMALLYLLHPLPIMEIAGSGHNDPVATLFLLLLLLARSPWTAGIFLGLCTGSKLWGLVLLPIVIQEFGWRSLITFAATTCLLYLPYLGAGMEVFSGLATYSSSWQSNDSIFSLLVLLVGGDFHAREISALLLASGLLLILIKKSSFEHKVLYAISLLLILSPVLHPWYLLWILPLALVLRRWEWIYLSLMVPVSYSVLPGFLQTGAWNVPIWARLVEYIPFYALLIGSSVLKSKKSRMGVLRGSVWPY